MIAILKYNAGNIRSVGFALDRLGVSYEITAEPDRLRAAERVIFPGVGAAGTTMAHLRESGLDGVIRQLTQPVLGICLGLQLLCTHSQENDTDCLGIFPNRVVRFRPESGEKVPHVGWNTIHFDRPSPFLPTEVSGRHAYYVHSYYAETGAHTAATTQYGATRFSACLRRDNFYAAQFHPEKSAQVGESILRAFLAS